MLGIVFVTGGRGACVVAGLVVGRQCSGGDAHGVEELVVVIVAGIVVYVCTIVRMLVIDMTNWPTTTVTSHAHVGVQAPRTCVGKKTRAGAAGARIPRPRRVR